MSRRLLPVLACAALLGGCASTSADPRDPLDQGEWRNTKSRMYQDLALQCLQAEDHDRARRLLQQAVQFDSRDQRTLELLARLAYSQGDFATANGAAQMLLQVAPKSVPAMCTIGAIHESQDRPAEAEASYRQALAVAGDDPRPAVDLHRFLLARGREAEAATLLAATALRFPRAIEPNLDRGAHFASTRRWDDASLAFDAALAVQPNDAGAAAGYALSAVMSQQPAAALALGERLPPHVRANNPSLLLLLAVAHLQSGDYAAALHELDLGDPQLQNRSSMCVLRGEILFRMQHFDAALAQFEQAVALDPEAARAHAGLGRIHLQLRRHHAAVRALQRATAIQPGNGASQALLAAALAAAGDHAAATRHATIARRLPGTSALLLQLERVYPWLAASEAGR